MKKKKLKIFIISILLFIGNINIVKASSDAIGDVCTNPDILRIIYFILIIIDIVKIIIPIGLIVMGIIDFSKAVISSDEKTQKKSSRLFMNRILCAVLVFIVPWIVKVLMVVLGDILGSGVINFTDCIQNANKETIAELDQNLVNE